MINKATVRAVSNIYWSMNNALLEDSLKIWDKLNCKSFRYLVNLSLYFYNIVILLIRNIYYVFPFANCSGI